MATIILGAQFGDEGKGKLTDILCPDKGVCARAAGGHNAGHSIKANGVSYDFHMLPSGLVNPSCQNVIGSGVVLHAQTFFKELATIEEKGLEQVRKRIFISDRCQINFDLHAKVDGLEEAGLGAKAIGTTKRGIGPAYSTKASRSGVRLHEVFDKETFDRKLRSLVSGFEARYGKLEDYDVEEEIKWFDEHRYKLADYTIDAVAFMTKVQDDNTPILVEGGQALMLDIDYGTYPYCTSSNTTLGGCISGLALDFRKISEVIGVVKAYTTRVGAGKFLTEDLGEAGTKMQEIGHEWGVSTGRRRRTGWLDLVMVKYSADCNHYTALNLTKLDVLDTFETIKVAVKYVTPDGQALYGFPADLGLLENCTPEYKEFPGWQTSTAKAKTFYDLPSKARAYIHFIEDFVGVPIKWIGTGPDREDMIKR
jgi:adenylosuccinate synthase